MKKCDDFVILICDYMHFALCTECVNVTLWIYDMLHAGMCSCLYGFVFTVLVLVVCCMALEFCFVFTVLVLVVCYMALEFCFVFVNLDGLAYVFENSISIYLEE
jgi:hypothetical protein